MLPRDRVLTAINHAMPDRVPIYIGGSASKYYKSMALKLMEKYHIPAEELDFVPTGFKFSPYCESLLEKFHVDVRYLYPNVMSREMQQAQQICGTAKNKWGGRITYPDADGEKAHLEFDPLIKEPMLELIETTVWPEPDEQLLYGLRERAEILSAEGRYAIGIYRPFEAGIFGTCRYFVRGFTEFLCDLLVEKDFASALMKKVFEVQKRYYDALLEVLGPYVDIVEIEDDLGMQDRPMISPDNYREMIKPWHAMQIQAIKQKTPNVKILMHSCGAIQDMLEDLIDIGVDIINPVQVDSAGMNIETLKNRFGSRITFQGGIDVHAPFLGTTADVEQVVKSTIDVMARNGGYLLGPSHNFSPNIPPENIIRMFEVAYEYGKHFSLTGGV